MSLQRIMLLTCLLATQTLAAPAAVWSGLGGNNGHTGYVCR